MNPSLPNVRFSGSLCENPRRFIVDYLNEGIILDWSIWDAVVRFPRCLTGSARSWCDTKFGFADLPPRDSTVTVMLNAWDILMDAFKAKYLSDARLRAARDLILDRRQGENESVTSYLEALGRLSNILADPEELVEIAISNMRPELSARMRSMTFDDLDSLAAHAQIVEQHVRNQHRRFLESVDDRMRMWTTALVRHNVFQFQNSDNNDGNFNQTGTGDVNCDEDTLTVRRAIERVRQALRNESSNDNNRVDNDDECHNDDEYCEDEEYYDDEYYDDEYYDYDGNEYYNDDEYDFYDNGERSQQQ